MNYQEATELAYQMTADGLMVEIVRTANRKWAVWNVTSDSRYYAMQDYLADKAAGAVR